MKLMLRSFSNLLLSVNKVTQKNKGRKTPGIDDQLVLTPKARIKLVNQMTKHQTWAAQPGKRIYIPKANGKRRPLGILTIKNRVAQSIVKNALEPSWEARFESNSYGFRPGRSCHDAIKQCWLRLHRGKTHQWVLDADVRAAFDNISQGFILECLGKVPGRELIKQWLLAGYVEAEIFHATTDGVQQGGVISPLIFNIALDGLEKILAPRAGYIRYADDMVITARTKEEIEALVPTVQKFLTERGLELNTEKSKIIHLKDGFNFLGFNVRSYNDKCIVKPQKEKVHTFLKGIRAWLAKYPSVSAERVVRLLNPKLRGWTNYYRHVNSKQTLKYVDTQIWRAVWKWCLKRHRNKSKAWVYRKYFTVAQNRSWTFFAKVPNQNMGFKNIFLFHCSKISIKPHVKVKGKASPDNPELHAYWQNRQIKRRQAGLCEDDVTIPWTQRA